MRRLLTSPERADQVIAASFSTWFLYSAALLWASWADEHSDTVPIFVDWLWPWVFAAAGLLGFAYVIWPASRHLAAWSGGIMIAALLSRAFTLLATLMAGKGPLSITRGLLGAGVWIILGYAVGLIWTHLLRPLSERRRRRC